MDVPLPQKIKELRDDVAAFRETLFNSLPLSEVIDARNKLERFINDEQIKETFPYVHNLLTIVCDVFSNADLSKIAPDSLGQLEKASGAEGILIRAVLQLLTALDGPKFQANCTMCGQYCLSSFTNINNVPQILCRKCSNCKK